MESRRCSRCKNATKKKKLLRKQLKRLKQQRKTAKILRLLSNFKFLIVKKIKSNKNIYFEYS